MAAEPHTTAEDALPPMPQYRGLKTAVIVMGILLVIGFIVVFSTIIYRAVNAGGEETAAGAGPSAPLSGYDQPIALPPGARVGQITPDNDRLVVEVTEEGGARLVIVLDARRGREIGRFRLLPQ